MPAVSRWQIRAGTLRPKRNATPSISPAPPSLKPASRMMFNNTCQDVLASAEQMMLGELAYKLGQIEGGIDHLHQPIALDDGLLYDEPWGWTQPIRHALC